jgi:hypothetical protein
MDWEEGCLSIKSYHLFVIVISGASITSLYFRLHAKNSAGQNKMGLVHLTPGAIDSALIQLVVVRTTASERRKLGLWVRIKNVSPILH